MEPPRTTRPRRRVLTRLAAALPLVAAALVSAVPSADAAASPNLLLNGTAETGQCSPGGWEETTVPGWRITSGDPVIDCYGMPAGPTASSPGSPARGTSYFQGGSRGNSQMTQTVDVSQAVKAIDAGSASSTLSGWLGGIGSYDDNAKVTATYLNASGTSLGTSTIGPVLAADRNGTTGTVQRARTSTVPAGTRSIAVNVDFSMTGTQNDGIADDLSLTLNTAVTAPALAVPASTVPAFDHVFIVMMENTNYSAGSNALTGSPGIVGNTTDAPYINNTLLPMGSLLTNAYAGTHNSDPNYEQIAFGNSYGRSAMAPGGNNSNCITSTACNTTNDGLGDRLDQAGKGWLQSTYGQTSACQTTSNGNYENDDVPFYYAPKMKNDNAYCQTHWPSWSQFTTDLQSASAPAFAWFAAGLCADFEGCTISDGDTWLKNTLPLIFDSPAWKTQRSLLIVTTDEDGDSWPGSFGPGQTNQVMTLAIGSQNTVKAGFRTSDRYDHYSTARVIRDALGLPPMTNNDKWATPYNEIFTNHPGGGSLDGPHTLTTSGKALDDPGASTTAGTPLVTWTPNGGANQTWNLTRQPDGSYQIASASSGLCADVSGGSTAASAQVIQWSCTGAANQHWLLTTQANGTYTFTSAKSGLLLTTASTTDGAPTTQQPDTGSTLQRWTIG